MKKLNKYIWETHGVHAGTEQDHVKHGVDDLNIIVEKAIEKGFPSVTFIIHSPRLTKYRYVAEKETNVKFIRGNKSYINYPRRICDLRKKYGSAINIKYGVELEWMGSDLGLQWNRSKLFQAHEADFVIGSVHFAPEGLPYDGSKKEALELLEKRGSLEEYWSRYFDEIMEMIEYSGDMIQVIGHIDLPKLNVDVPDAILNFETSIHPLSNKFRTLLENIADRNLALDVNISGKVKGVGIYPSQNILKYAKTLNIPITIGTDTHKIDAYGQNYEEGLNYVHKAGYMQYLSFSKLIPEQRTIFDDHDLKVKYTILNKGISFLNQRNSSKKRKIIPEFSFGGEYSDFLKIYPRAVSMGEYNAIRIRKGIKSITITGETPKATNKKVKGLLSEHLDNPGVISSLFNTLASEKINVETARLKSNNDGTATALLTISGEDENIKEAIEFIKGTDKHVFTKLSFEDNIYIPNYYRKGKYLLEIDGVELKIALTNKMIVTKHQNAPGVLLILLSALASKNINIVDLRLGKRNNTGYAALAIEGDTHNLDNVLKKLGPLYYEVSFIVF